MRSSICLRVFVFVFIALPAAPAFARTDTPTSQPDSLGAHADAPTVEENDPTGQRSPRLRLGVGANGVFLNYSAVGFGPGLSLRCGVRLSDLFVVDAELSGLSIVVAGYARLAVTAGVTPLSWLTLSTGPVVGAQYLVALSAFTGGVIGNTFVGGTLHIDFKIGDHVTLGLAGDLGRTKLTAYSAPWVPGPSGDALVTIGYSLS